MCSPSTRATQPPASTSEEDIIKEARCFAICVDAVSDRLFTCIYSLYWRILKSSAQHQQLVTAPCMYAYIHVWIITFEHAAPVLL